MTRRPTGFPCRLAGVAALAAVAATALNADQARAHPHVFVTMTSELIYGEDGAVTGVRQAWTFDDMYTAFAVQGLEQKTAGAFTREELAPVAADNMTSLKELDYFTFLKLDGKKAEYADPVDYWSEYKDATLTLHFTLPLKAPAKARRLDLEVYDPSYYVDFSFANDKALALAGAPASCRFTLAKPGEAEATAKIQSLGEAAFAGADGANYGAMFASKVSVTCP